jgi:hypothetical protein
VRKGEEFGLKLEKPKPDETPVENGRLGAAVVGGIKLGRLELAGVLEVFEVNSPSVEDELEEEEEERDDTVVRGDEEDEDEDGKPDCCAAGIEFGESERGDDRGGVASRLESRLACCLLLRPCIEVTP